MWLFLNMHADFYLKSLLSELMGSMTLAAVGIEPKGCSSLCQLLLDDDNKWRLLVWDWMGFVCL